MMNDDVVAAGALLAGMPADDGLDDALYAWFLALTPLPARAVDMDLAGALDAAHADATRFVGGWRAESVTALGGVVARCGSLQRHLGRAAYTVPARPGLPARAGDALLARAAWTWIDEEHGFWYTRRGSWPPPGADRLVRTYLNATPDDAPRVVAALTALLAAHREVPYHLKTPLTAGHGGRADAVVLYLGAPDAASLDGRLRTVVGSLGGVLRPARPRFTAALGPGAGQAEGPLDGDSFGTTRCKLLAAAWRALDPLARRDPDAITAAIVAGFTAAGIDPARPHLLGVTA